MCVGGGVKQHWCCMFYFMVVFGTVIPNMLTDSLNISNEEFVNIYAKFRHPWHLVPSSWDKFDIVYSLMLIIFPFCFRLEYLYFNERKKIKNFFIHFLFFVISWIGALLFMYIGTEQLNIVTVTTMFISKFFKYIAIIALICYIGTVQDYFGQARYFLAFFVLTFAGSAYLMGQYMPIIFMCLITYVYYVYRNQKPERRDCIYIGLLWCIFILIEIFAPGFGTVTKEAVVILLIGCAITLFEMWQLRMKRLYIVTILLILSVLSVLCLRDTVVICSGKKISIVTSQDVLTSSIGEDIYQLAKDFGERTERTESFLADPNVAEPVEGFQIVSERNCYVVHKIIPTSKGMVKEWYTRYQKVRGLFDKEVDEIIKVMKDTNNIYILVDDDHYSKFDNNIAFSVFSECDNDSYRIYKLCSN